MLLLKVVFKLQDYLGRVGYWNIGIPPSDPMDSLAFRIADRLVGNREGAAGLEITARGSKIMFLEDSKIALTGAELHSSLDGKEIPWWKASHPSNIHDCAYAIGTINFTAICL